MGLRLRLPDDGYRRRTKWKIYDPPLRGVGTELYVSMDLLGDREIEFRKDSSLMILRNACRKARSECGVYYFNWKDEHFELVTRTLIDLTIMK
jgi:hypothetical protein